MITPKQLRELRDDKALSIGDAWNALGEAAETIEEMKYECYGTRCSFDMCLDDCESEQDLEFVKTIREYLINKIPYPDSTLDYKAHLIVVFVPDKPVIGDGNPHRDDTIERFQAARRNEKQED